MIKIQHVTVSEGQVRPYADSVYIYDVTAPEGATDEQVWEACQTLRKCANRDQNRGHNGSCSFPYGMQSFGSLKPIEGNSYRYSVTEPYTG